jgi:hypothetical protein
MRCVVLSLVLTLALVMAPMQLAVLALGDVQVTLTCSNGTEIMDTVLVVDADVLSALQSAVDSMVLYPAGLVCRITQQLLGSLGGFFGPRVAFAQGNPQWNYAVGGGQAPLLFGCAADELTNFGFSARVDPALNGTTGQGMIEFTIPKCTSGGTTVEGSHLGARVDCLDVAGANKGGTARMTAEVKNVTHVFASSFSPGDHITVQVFDANLQDGTGDTIDTTGAGPDPCDFGETGGIAVTRGNISVHQAGP